MKRIVSEKLFLYPVELIASGGQIVVGCQKETAGAARRIADGLHRFRSHHFHNGLDQRARGEVLTRAAFGVLGVFLQQALVDVSLHIGIQAAPRLIVDELNDSFEFGGVLNLVLGFSEDDAQRAALPAQFVKDVAVVGFEGVAVFVNQALPVQSGGDDGRLAEWRFGLLVRHFQEQQIGQLFHIIAVTDAVIAEDVTVIPQFLYNG